MQYALSKPVHWKILSGVPLWIIQYTIYKPVFSKIFILSAVPVPTRESQTKRLNSFQLLLSTLRVVLLMLPKTTYNLHSKDNPGSLSLRPKPYRLFPTCSILSFRYHLLSILIVYHGFVGLSSFILWVLKILFQSNGKDFSGNQWKLKKTECWNTVIPTYFGTL